MQALPGVVIGTNDFRNDIIVRGGSPLENLFVVDNVEIPNINAFANFASAGGTVGLLDAQLLQDVTFLTGGYPAPYINRTSSVLQVTQREGNRREFGGWATLGFAGAGAILEGPMNAGKGSWVVSARRSFLDRSPGTWGCGVPVVDALNGKAVYDFTPRDRLWVVNIAGVDEIRLGLNESTDLDDEIANFDIRYAGWRSATGFNWQRTFGSRGVGLFGITHSEAKVGQQVKDLVAQGVPPPGVPPDDIIAESPVVYFEDSREGETTLKYDLTVRLPLFDTVQAGGSFKTFRIDYTVESPYGGTIRRTRRWPRIDPFFLDSASVVLGRRNCRPPAGGRTRERHAGGARRPLRRPVELASVQSARGRQGTPHRRALVELERRVLLPAAGLAFRVGVSRETRSLACPGVRATT